MNRSGSSYKGSTSPRQRVEAKLDKAEQVALVLQEDAEEQTEGNDERELKVVPIGEEARIKGEDANVVFAEDFKSCIDFARGREAT